MKVARLLRIEGRVQGVGFRYGMQEKARQLGLTGWVRNRHDDSVEAIVCSDNMQAINEIIAWAQHGPSLANVINVAVSETAAPPDVDFAILPTA